MAAQYYNKYGRCGARNYLLALTETNALQIGWIETPGGIEVVSFDKRKANTGDIDGDYHPFDMDYAAAIIDVAQKELIKARPIMAATKII